MSHTRLASRRRSPRGEAMTHACPPSRVPPLLEPLEPRLRPASSLPINDIAASEGLAGNAPFAFRSHGRQPARAEFASRRLAFPNIFR
jgi:hypothetical protein